jgi:hypothetical protein
MTRAHYRGTQFRVRTCVKCGLFLEHALLYIAAFPFPSQVQYYCHVLDNLHTVAIYMLLGIGCSNVRSLGLSMYPLRPAINITFNFIALDIIKLLNPNRQITVVTPSKP